MAAALRTAQVGASTLAQTMALKVEVTGRAKFKFRVAIGCWLLRLAARIIGTMVVIDVVSADAEFDDGKPDYVGHVKVGDLILPACSSCRSGSPLPKWNFDWSKQVDIYLDGVLQKEVVSYHIPRGLLRRNVLRKDGEAQLNAARDGILTEVVSGRVELRLKA